MAKASLQPPASVTVSTSLVRVTVVVPFATVNGSAVPLTVLSEYTPPRLALFGSVELSWPHARLSASARIGTAIDERRTMTSRWLAICFTVSRRGGQVAAPKDFPTRARRACDLPERTVMADRTKPRPATTRTVLARVVKRMVDHAVAEGLDRDALIEASGLAGIDLSDGDARVPVSAQVALWRLLAKGISDPGFGVRMGASFEV